MGLTKLQEALAGVDVTIRPCQGCGKDTETHMEPMERRRKINPFCAHCYEEHYQRLCDLAEKELQFFNTCWRARKKKRYDDKQADSEFLQAYKSGCTRMTPAMKLTEMQNVRTELELWQDRMYKKENHSSRGKRVNR